MRKDGLGTPEKLLEIQTSLPRLLTQTFVLGASDIFVANPYDATVRRVAKDGATKATLQQYRELGPALALIGTTLYLSLNESGGSVLALDVVTLTERTVAAFEPQALVAADASLFAIDGRRRKLVQVELGACTRPGCVIDLFDIRGRYEAAEWTTQALSVGGDTLFFVRRSQGARDSAA